MIMKFFNRFDRGNSETRSFSQQREVFLGEGFNSHKERHAAAFGGQIEQLLVVGKNERGMTGPLEFKGCHFLKKRFCIRPVADEIIIHKKKKDALLSQPC